MATHTIVASSCVTRHRFLDLPFFIFTFIYPLSGSDGFSLSEDGVNAMCMLRWINVDIIRDQV